MAVCADAAEKAARTVVTTTLRVRAQKDRRTSLIVLSAENLSKFFESSYDNHVIVIPSAQRSR